MAIPGRPRKQGPRYKNVRLKPRKDLGTDELRAKKVALVGPDGDPTKSTNVIDIRQSWGKPTIYSGDDPFDKIIGSTAVLAVPRA